MSQTCVIVGAGHAAAQLAPTLRHEGWDGRIIVIGDDSCIPYHRPPLSKALLAGEKTLDDIYIRPARVYEKDNIEFMLNTRVLSIDRTNRQLVLDNGELLPYDKLALTTGSRVRRIEVPGVELGGIYYLRDYRDAQRIRAGISAGGRVVIVGGGYIGLEAASVLRKKGMNVTVVEMMDRILQRVTAPQISDFFSRIHGEEGVNIICRTVVESFAGEKHVEQVICNDGKHYDADLVIVGIGILPNLELAESAGLDVSNGIVVDENCRTTDPDIVAAGDCTFHYNKIYDRWLRLESVQNAAEQSRSAAAAICGHDKPYYSLPWFWSDQFDLKLQMAGLSEGYDDVVTRGDRNSSRSFAAFYFRDNFVIAVDAVNKPPEFMLGKKLITDRIVVDKNRLADENVPMKDFLS